ncbi:unnamed protein product, partial [Staurois parvus]
MLHHCQGWTDNSWGPRAIGDHGAPVSLLTLKPHPKKPMEGTRGISWGPLLTPGPRAVPEFPNGQSAPAKDIYSAMHGNCDMSKCYLSGSPWLQLFWHVAFLYCIVKLT